MSVHQRVCIKLYTGRTMHGHGLCISFDLKCESAVLPLYIASENLGIFSFVYVAFSHLIVINVLQMEFIIITVCMQVKFSL